LAKNNCQFSRNLPQAYSSSSPPLLPCFLNGFLVAGEGSKRRDWAVRLYMLIRDAAVRRGGKIKIKQKVSGFFRTDGGADDFAKLHSIAETAMKNGNSKFKAILAVVLQ